MPRIIIMALAAIILISPVASAIKRVPRNDTKAHGDTVQKANPSGPEKSKQSPGVEKGRNSSNDANKVPSKPPEQKKNVEKDKFVDENGDGINDNIKKPPEVIKKKKENPSEKKSPKR